MNTTKSWTLLHRIDAYKDKPLFSEVAALLSADGRRIISRMYSTDPEHRPLPENEPLIWDAESGKLLRAIPLKEQEYRLALSRDGLRAITGSRDNTVRLWDIESGNLLNTRRIVGSVIEYGLVIKYGKKILQINDAESAIELRRLKQSDPGDSVAISGDGKCIVEGSHDGWVRYWNADNQERVLQAKGPVVHCVGVSADGSRIAAGSWDGSVRLWDGDSGDELQSFRNPEHSIDDVLLSANGRIIVVSLHNGPLVVWDTASGMESNLSEYTTSGNNVAVSADGSRVVVTSLGKIEVWGEVSQDDQKIVSEPGKLLQVVNRLRNALRFRSQVVSTNRQF